MAEQRNSGVPPQPRRIIARHFQNKFVDAVEVITNELPISLSTYLRQLKVLLKLFQKLAVSKGGAFGGF